MPEAKKELEQELERLLDKHRDRVHVINDDELAKFWQNFADDKAVKPGMVNWKKIEVKEVDESVSLPKMQKGVFYQQGKPLLTID